MLSLSMKFYSYLIAGMILLMPCLAKADIYSYIDDQGIERFVDRRSAVPKRYKDQLETVLKDLPNSGRKVSISNADIHKNRSKPKDRNFQSENKVEIFITSWCPYCQRLEKFLRSANIKYTRYDIESSKKGARIYKQLNGNGVPITRIGSQIIPGYNPDGILKALGR